MPRPLRIDYAGGVYHVTARGNEKRVVFRDDADRFAYLDRLAECSRRYEFRVYAFCLMGNHVHLALERGPVKLSRIVLALHSAYAQRFNRRHARVGHLFQGRYKAYLVEKESYLLTLVRYIHLNPVKAGTVARPEIYRWSSDRFYRGLQAPAWLDVGTLFSMLGTDRAQSAAAYRRYMAVDDESYEAVRPKHAVIIGTEDFAMRAVREVDAPLERRRWSIPAIAACAAASGGYDGEQLRQRARLKNAALLRSLAGYIGREYAGIPVSRMARFFRRDESTVVRSVLRLENDLRSDPILRARLRDVVAALECTSARLTPRGKSRLHG